MAIRFGEFVLDTQTRQVTRAGEALPMSPKAFQLLRILVDARPGVVPKSELIDQLWPDVTVEEANVRNLIAEIRQVLGDNGSEARYIRTAHRLGYAFTGSIASSQSRARLIDRDQTYALFDGMNLIGRGDDCSVLLNASGVSRHHAKVTLEGQRTVLEDLGSKNGTWLNGERIKAAAELKDGDTVKVGVADLRFRSEVTSDSTATVDY